MKQTQLHKKIDKLLQKLAVLPSLAETAFFNSLKSYTSDMEVINRETLYDGMYVNTTYIEPAYKQTTIRIKKAKGQRFDVVTLKDTGAFHKSINYRVQKNEVIISATDKKAPLLNRKYRNSDKKELYGMPTYRYDGSIYPLAVKLANLYLFKELRK